MKRRLLILGASGHGKVAADIAIKMNCWETVNFLDDDKSIVKCMNLDVIGKIEDAPLYSEDSDYFVAIGNNNTRERIQNELQRKKLAIATLIHPDAILASDVHIGTGSIIMAAVVINPSTTIGIGCIINTSSSIDHDNIIGDFVHISPGVHTAGSVHIDGKTWVGVGTTVINNISIYSQVVIGAGSVVIEDITEDGTYVGVPCKRLIIEK